MTNLTICKSISQLRFPSAALIFDNRGQIATEWQHKQGLSEWRITQNNVIIHNLDNSIQLSAGLRDVTVTTEMPPTYEDFQKLAADFTLKTLGTLNPDKISRVGLRLIFVAERPHFRQLVNKMRTQLYKLQERDWNIFGGYPEDIGSWSLVFKRGVNRVNFSVGPMEKAQLAEQFNSEAVKKQLPDVAVFIDIDMSQFEPKWSRNARTKQVLAFLTEGGSEIQQLAENFLDNFGGFI